LSLPSATVIIVGGVVEQQIARGSLPTIGTDRRHYQVVRVESFVGIRDVSGGVVGTRSQRHPFANP